MSRDRLFNMRMNEEECARLSRIADYYGLNHASVIRMLLAREDRALSERQGFTKAKKTTKKTKG